jgi:hypothetical protein
VTSKVRSLTGPGWRTSWYSRGWVTVPLPWSSTSVPCAAPRGPPVDTHPQPHGLPWRGRCHDQVQVAGVEAVGDPPVGLVQHGGLAGQRPVPGQGPMVEDQPRGGGIALRGIQDRTVGRGEVLAARVAQVGLRDHKLSRSAAASTPPGSTGTRSWPMPPAGGGQQPAAGPARTVRGRPRRSDGAEPALGVDDVGRRPVVVVERAPDGVVVADRDRIPNPQVGGGWRRLSGSCSTSNSGCARRSPPARGLGSCRPRRGGRQGCGAG